MSCILFLKLTFCYHIIHRKGQSLWKAIRVAFCSSTANTHTLQASQRHLTQSPSRTWRRGRSRSSEQSRTERRRPGRWSERRSDTSSSPSYRTNRPTPMYPPSWPHTPADLQTHRHSYNRLYLCTTSKTLTWSGSWSPPGVLLYPHMNTDMMTAASFHIQSHQHQCFVSWYFMMNRKHVNMTTEVHER